MKNLVGQGMTEATFLNFSLHHAERDRCVADVRAGRVFVLCLSP